MKRHRVKHNPTAPAAIAGAVEHLPEVINFDYQGNMVSFTVNGKVMVNATNMAKPFGEAKSPKFWLNNQNTSEFLNELTKVRILTLADLVKVTKGGTNPGTWMHEDVALEFARWLSPKFAIWCNDRIKELVKGKMPAPFNPEALYQSMQALADLTTQNFTVVRNEIAGIDDRLRAIEQHRQPEVTQSFRERREERHDQMDLVIVNFQMPVYLKRKMNIYCSSKSISFRDFLTGLVQKELVNELKI